MENLKNEYGYKEVEDSFEAYLVKGASFTRDEEYPVIPSKFVSKTIPKRIMPFEKAINYKGDLSDTFICVFSRDKSFERIRRNPKRYIHFFKRTAGLIGFDYSIHTDMPIVKQKSQINDNLSLTYYYGKNGIPIIPNLRCGVSQLLPEFLEAIPNNSLIAIGTHGFIKYKYEKYEWYCFLEEIIKRLEPTGIIVYGTLKSPIFDSLKKQTKLYYYKPIISDIEEGGYRYVD